MELKSSLLSLEIFTALVVHDHEGIKQNIYLRRDMNKWNRRRRRRRRRSGGFNGDERHMKYGFAATMTVSPWPSLLWQLRPQQPSPFGAAVVALRPSPPPAQPGGREKRVNECEIMDSSNSRGNCVSLDTWQPASTCLYGGTIWFKG